jgi:TonB family protein
MVHVPPPPKEQPKRADAAPVKIEAPKAPERVEARVEPAPAPAPVVEKPKPALPTVKVGSFDLNSGARNPDVTRSVQTAEFDAPAARAAELRIATANVGSFEQADANGRPRPGTDRPVGDAGFGSGLAAGPTRAAGRVSDAGFGSGGTGTGPARSGRGGVVAAGGFDSGKADVQRAQPSVVKASDFDARGAQTAAPQARQRPVETPLEILSKPIPAYTDEARQLKIEGEVTLEVEFTADGGVRVMRIVRGLGHGLDESAMRAVQAMRFKPAQRNGEPVDIRTTVNIVFRLA